MVGIEEKLNFFSKIIQENIEKDKEKTLELFKKKSETLLNEEKARLDAKEKSILDDAKSKAENKYKELIAKEDLAMKELLLTKKNNFINEILDVTKNKLIDFSKSKNYKKFLLSNLENTFSKLNEGDYVIYLSPKDIKGFKNDINEVVTKFNGISVELKELTHNIIGGSIIESSDGKFRFNNTLLSKLEQQKEFIGLKITNELNRR